MALAKQLAEVMHEVGYVQKDSMNDFHHYKYASAEAVLKKVNVALSSRGIAASTRAELVSQEIIKTDKGAKVLAVVKLSMDFTDGQESITAEGLGSGMDSADKAVMKANTAALKYLVANAFLISWGDDPEADNKVDQIKIEAENPFTDDEPVSYPEARPIVAAMKGKRGVRELKTFLGHAQTLGWGWDQALGFAKTQGVDLLNGLNYSSCAKLRDMVKAEKGVGS